MNKFSAILTPKPIILHSIRSMHRVFVYGTLKQNEPNNHWLTDEKNGVSNFVGNGTTKTKYPLIIATKYNIPFLLFSPGRGHFVEGEVYEVDEKMLGKLDILEDHPNYYVRQKDDILLLEQDAEEDESSVISLKCWVYFLKKFKPELLKRPMLDNYSSTGSHGLPYMDRSKRDPLHNYKAEIKGDSDAT